MIYDMAHIQRRTVHFRRPHREGHQQREPFSRFRGRDTEISAAHSCPRMLRNARLSRPRKDIDLSQLRVKTTVTAYTAFKNKTLRSMVLQMPCWNIVDLDIPIQMCWRHFQVNGRSVVGQMVFLSQHGDCVHTSGLHRNVARHSKHTMPSNRLPSIT